MRDSKNKTTASLFLGTVILCSLLSCVSTNPFERTDSDQCVLLIPLVIENSAGTVIPWKLRFVNTNTNYVNIELPLNFEGFIPILLTKKSEYNGIEGRIGASDFTGSNFVQNFGYDLPYSPGGIEVADFGIRLTQTKSGENSYSTTISYYKTVSGIDQTIVAAAKKVIQFKSWFEN